MGIPPDEPAEFFSHDSVDEPDPSVWDEAKASAPADGEADDLTVEALADPDIPIPRSTLVVWEQQMIELRSQIDELQAKLSVFNAKVADWKARGIYLPD